MSRRSLVAILLAQSALAGPGAPMLLRSADAQTLSRPSPRSGHGMAFDSRRSRIVLFGGSDSTFQRLGDTWEWDSRGWTRVELSGPPARSDFAMTFDMRRGRVVIFGGRLASGLGHDTWEYDGARWMRIDTLGPPARALASMAYDEARGRVVLFGGSTGSARLADTWEWDGRVWNEVRAVGVSPSARGSHAMVYDGAVRRIVVIGGYDDRALSETWAWDGITWVRGTDGPPLLHTAAAFDAAHGDVIVFGGFHENERTSNVWRRTQTEWTVVEGAGPPARAEHRAVYVPGIGLVVFGGIGGQGMSTEERGRAKLNDLWSFDGMQWRRLDPR
jgi:hypothetical protein